MTPNLLQYWSPNNKLDPSEISAKNNKVKCLWICVDCGTEFIRTCYRRQESGRCRQCAIKKRDKDQSIPSYKKSLGYLYPSIASTWSNNNPCTPFDVYPKGHSHKYLWICTECNSEFERTCADRHKSGKCNRCSFIKIGKKHSQPTPFHSFGDLYPGLLKEYSSENIRNPYSLKPGSSYVASWICTNCGHNWQANCYTRTGPNKSGCPHCCNRNSEPEQSLRNALLPFGASPNPQTKLGKWNVDIYFPEKKTIVEYDGSHWHHKPENYERDKRKSLELLEIGYRVVRVRTWSSKYKLETLGICSSGYYEILIQEPINSKPTEDLVLDILHKVR